MTLQPSMSDLHEEGSPMKRLLRPILLALAGMSVACQQSSASPTAPPPPAISVETAAVEIKPMPKSLVVTGSLVANRRSDVAANASGRVVKTFIDRGSDVGAGAPLVQLDTRAAALAQKEAKANLSTVETQVEFANAGCARADSLYEKGAITKEAWERASSQCQTSEGTAEAAKVRAEMATKTLVDSTVRAPFAGTISERLVNVGEFVQPPTRVAVLVELSPLRLQFGLDEAHVGRVQEGQEVSFAVEALPGETFTGVVKYLDPAVRSLTRDLVVEAEVANEDHRLRAGMFVTARLQLPDEPAVTVPKRAITTDSSGSHVFAVVDKMIEERIVQLGPERDGRVAVLDGLKRGDRVVVSLGEQVKDGVPVK